MTKEKLAIFLLHLMMERKHNELSDKLNKAEANLYDVKNKHLYVCTLDTKYRQMLEEKDHLQQTYKLNLEEMMKQNNLLEAQKKTM